ncbi:MAG: HAMP domain-containing histidine kinase [Eubacterium sp.]|nr:HAMP domain-containing histidine kinase [Eubacterium sp.]
MNQFRSFRFRIVLYMFLSIIATIVTEAVLFFGIYLYENEMSAGRYREIWGASGNQKGAFGLVAFNNLSGFDIAVLLFFSVLLMILYFVLFSHGFVVYVREIIQGIEKMKNGNFSEEIPVRGNDEFSEIADSINEMRRNLGETLAQQKMVEETKDELVTNVAHDLRTPLTSILGYLDLLQQKDDLTEEQQQKYLGIVTSKARQLETLIKDLFDYTRYDKDKVKIKKEILDLNLFMPQLVDEFYPSFMENHLNCVTHFCEGPLNIEGNGELLARAIGNLMANAIKYGADGKLLEVYTGRLSDYAFVAIVNYGRVIPSEDLEKIFDKFYRVENSRSLKTGGTGLGLTIAKNIVTLHDGNIWAMSGDNGTRFQMEIPLVNPLT